MLDENLNTYIMNIIALKALFVGITIYFLQKAWITALK